MFLSASKLAITYGVNDTIAKFFVDREPPKGNRYWEGKLLYMRPDPGYLFIPLAVDLCNKLGIERDTLLSSTYVEMMEAIGHIIGQHEFKELNDQEAFDALIQLATDKHINKQYYLHITDYFKGGTNNPFVALRSPFKALHRGDAFLLSFCVLEFDEAKSIELVKFWFALITTLLALDDAEDINIDEKSGDENAFLEAGLNKEGIEKIKTMIGDNLKLIGSINRTMASGVDGRVKKMYDMAHIQRFL